MQTVKRFVEHVVGPARCKLIRCVHARLLKKDMGYTSEYYESFEEHHKHFYQALTDTLVAQFNPKSVIDIGCGTGEMSLAFIRAGCQEVFSFDYSKEAIKRAKKKGLISVYRIV